MATEIRRASDFFIRPNDTTAYADTDLVANDTTAGAVVPLNFGVGRGGFKIIGARIEKSDAADVANATFTLHLFTTSPTVANGDNGTISHTVSGKLGTIAFPIMVAGTDDAYSVVNQGMTALVEGIPGYTASSTVYGLLEAKAAYQGLALETFTVTLLFEKN